PPPPPTTPPGPTVGGNITLEADGLIDVSGGPGDIGGNARNDGTSHVSTDEEVTSVVFDGDSGSTHGAYIVNNGMIIARGASHDGAGGDVIFHGRGVDQRDPPPGRQDRSGDGTGRPGDYLSD
ncbi:MAG: hypothetical protein HYY16_00330, partial [Planctomycetes bacterium]|nr:hypothetical protein [Planctomycetota bacterium]